MPRRSRAGRGAAVAASTPPRPPGSARRPRQRRRAAGGRPARRRAASARPRGRLVARPAWSTSTTTPTRPSAAAVHAVRDAYGHHLVAVWEARGDRLAPRAVAGAAGRRRPAWSTCPAASGSSARRSNWPPAGDRTGPRRDARPPARWPGERPAGGPPRRPPRTGRGDPRAREPWGVLHVVGEAAARSVRATSTSPGSSPTPSGRWSAAPSGPRRSPTCSTAPRPSAGSASDIGSRLDLDRILSGLVDHAMVLFEGDRAAVFLRSDPTATSTAEVSRGLSAAYLASVRDFPARSLPAAAVAARRPLFSVGYRNDPRGAGVRAAVVQEGFDTLCTAPLIDGDELLGLLNVYHDRPHPWTADELETIAALATQASVAIRAAQDFERMATWAAQLQSIQQLGARLNRLSSVRRDRPGHRHRAAPAHRLPQRPRLPAGRQRPHPGRDAGPGRRVRRRDAGPAAGRGRRGHHRLGRRAPRRPEPRRRRRRPAGQTRSRAPRTTSTSRCSSRRCCSTTRCSACSCSRSSASTSSPTTTCGCS